MNEDRTTEDERRLIFWLTDSKLLGQYFRYILEARKRALAKKKKLRTLGKRTRSADSEDEVEEDGTFYTYISNLGKIHFVSAETDPRNIKFSISPKQ